MAIKYNESARHWAQSNEIVRTKAIRVGLKIIKMREGRRSLLKDREKHHGGRNDC